MTQELHRIHNLPMPPTRRLCRLLRRQTGDEAADALRSVLDEIVEQTMRGSAPSEEPEPAGAIDRLVGAYAPLRSRWLDAMRAATRPEHLLDLHVAAFMTAGQQSEALPTRRTRRRLGDALETVPAIIDLHESVLIRRMPLDAAPLRRLATRFDWCVAAAIAAATTPDLPGLTRAIPLLCDEAYESVQEMKAIAMQAAGVHAPAAGQGTRRYVPAPCPN